METASEERVAGQAVTLEEKVDILKREVDSLQITLSSSRKPWYQNASTLLSVVALLFSFGTTYVSYKRAEAQDNQSLRQELRSLLQRLTSMPKDAQELMIRYQDDPRTAGTLSGFIWQEAMLLGRQASELARRLPRDAISPLEYYGVATALLSNSADLDTAEDFFGRALSGGVDMQTEVSALRGLGWLYFIKGESERGRSQYRQALDIFKKHPKHDQYTVMSTHFLSHMAWAISEAAYGQKPLATAHLNAAEELTSTVPYHPGIAQFRAQVAQVREQIAAGEQPNVPGLPAQAPPAGQRKDGR